eukprot:CAMPEP_0197037080 /NCGR_PEP_ID=MMETSP1384-20130603/14381_1 /TAXON_ID=29189 /ORGANISM="Ammonia sp." /LENGTH=235 /DNA_ID=CAMNT_0042467333 /DNA_START=14 /DNA_END=721 /DNA_ORIENTATION=+
MASSASSSSFLMVRVNHGNKKKLFMFEPDLKWNTVQQKVMAIFPSLKQHQLNEWHLEYDSGTWLEDDGDWAIFNVYYHHLLKRHGELVMEMYVVIGNDMVGGNDSVSAPPLKKSKSNDGNAVVVPPPTFYAPVHANRKMNVMHSYQNDSHHRHEHAQQHSTEEEQLWTRIVRILQSSTKPVSVLEIRRRFDCMPKASRLNKILYHQMRNGNLIMYPPNDKHRNQKPLWTICRASV